jgi:REP element-mobilizing transposase RayT
LLYKDSRIALHGSMRRRRYKITGEAVYELGSRTLPEILLEEDDKQALRDLLYRAAAFCGIVVLREVVLSDHFHVVVQTLALPASTDAERVERYRALDGGERGFLRCSSERLAEVLAEGGEQAAEFRRRLDRDRGDISAFMKILKERMTRQVNRSRDRAGTIWRDRFTSTLLENARVLLKRAIRQVDENPLRLGIVEHPCQYPWSTVGGPRERIPAAYARVKERLWAFFCAPGGPPPGFPWGWMAERYFGLSGEGHPYRRMRPHACFSRGGIVGSEKFVRLHSRRWLGRARALPVQLGSRVSAFSAIACR